MKAFFLFTLAVGGLTVFVVWQLLSCPECHALQPNSDSSQTPIEMPEEQLEDQVLEEDQVLTENQQTSPAPYFVLEDLDGNQLSLADFSGKNILLVSWATACGWCEKELPDLMRFTREQKGKIEVLAISQEPKALLRRYVKEREINFLLLLDPNGKTKGKYQILGTPSHVLIDKQAKIITTRPGYASYDDLVMLAESLEAR